MSHLIISISGIRGIPGETLITDNLVDYAHAFAALCGGGPVVIGYDGRPSGVPMLSVVSGALALAGIDVIDVGMAPTPTVQLAVERKEARGGIVITASHNPAQWNGLKFLDHTGVFLNAQQNEEFLALVNTPTPVGVAWEYLGSIVRYQDALRDHQDAVLRIPFIDFDAIRRRRFHVVVDAVNASGSIIVPSFLESLGCRVTRLYCDATGLFPHTPEPIPRNLTSLGEAVVAGKADLGIAVDPDADRLVLFCENGEPYGEEYTITTAVDAVLARIPDPGGQTVAVNFSTTRAVEDVAARYGAVVVRAAVGEINVVQKMKQCGAIIGGEGSGGVILPAVHSGRDSLVGLALVLAAFAGTDGTVSQYKTSLPQYAMKKTKYGTGAIDPARALQRAASAFAEERINTEDGVRIDFSDGWVHLRRSNTEPILRIIAEGRTRHEADDYAALAARTALGDEAVELQ